MTTPRSTPTSAETAPQKAGDILGIGGAGSGIGWGCNPIEVREATGPVGWAWRHITPVEKQILIDALNRLSAQDKRVEELEEIVRELASTFATDPASGMFGGYQQLIEEFSRRVNLARAALTDGAADE